MSPEGVAAETRVVIETDADIASACQRGRTQALQIGFSAAQAALLATGISELARNVLRYAGRGEIVLSTLTHSGSAGIGVSALDHGHGNADRSRALEAGQSSSGRLGLGLPGVKRLADDFEVRTSAEGTVVSMKMWVHGSGRLGVGERMMGARAWEWDG